MTARPRFIPAPARSPSPMTARPGFHICVRRTLAWDDPAAVERDLDPGFRAKYEAWNATFELPYAAFRARLAEIAAQSWSRVEGVRCTPLADVPAGDWVIPVDDDDWFAPQLGARLRALLAGAGADVTGCRWRRDVLEPDAIRRGLRARLRRRRALEMWTCGTNNYALRWAPGREEVLRNHVRASEHFDVHPAQVARTREWLAVQNRNPASQTALRVRRPTISRDQLVAVRDAYRATYARWRPRRSLRWARPYADAVAELVAGLRER